MSYERRQLIQAFGAEIMLTPRGANIQEEVQNSLNIMMQLAAEDPRVFLPRQFENPDNSRAHREGTGQEIIEQLDGLEVHGFGTGGTITGISEALRKIYPNIRIAVVGPDNAAILSGMPMGHHRQQGIGDGIIPIILNCKLMDEIILVSDTQAINMSCQLAHKEGFLCGVSGGTNVHGALELAKRLGNEHVMVPSSRYLRTLFKH